MPTHQDSLDAGGFVSPGSKRRDDPIDIVAWDPAWPRAYEEMHARLAVALAGQAVRIEHVGSTSIDGVPAKPIIDIQVSVADVDDDDAYRARIEGLGFEL